MNFTLDEKKYLIHAINELTKKEGIANAGTGIDIIRKLQDPATPEANGLDQGDTEDGATS